MKTIINSCYQRTIDSWFTVTIIIFGLLLAAAVQSCTNEDDYSVDKSAIGSAYLKSSNTSGILYYGHTTFTRSSGKPVIVTQKLENTNFEHFDGNFVLNIQNGSDKNTRVSSAKIWIDGKLVVGPSEFSKNVSLISKQLIGLTAESILEVELNSSPGSFIDIWIGGTLKPNHAMVTRSGGTFSFLNDSLIFIIPPGAIEETTFISVSDVTNELPIEVKQNMDQVFRFLPEGQNFDLPIKCVITLPTRLQNTGCPTLLEINMTYRFGLRHDSQYDVAANSWSFELEHFSYWGSTSFFKLLNKNCTFNLENYPNNYRGFPEESDDSIKQNIISDVKRSFGKWGTYSSSFNVTFEYSEHNNINNQSLNIADIIVEFVTWENAKEKYGLKPSLSSIGASIINLNNKQRKILLNDSFYYSSTYVLSKSGPSDINCEGVITHEIGHIFGLNDQYKGLSCYNYLSVMGNYYAERFPISLFTFDLKSLQAYYMISNEFRSAYKLETESTSQNITFVKGETIFNALKIRVTDIDDKVGIKNVTVVFYSPNENIGYISNPVTYTDENGIAKINKWTLPNIPGEYKIYARAWLDPFNLNTPCTQEHINIVREVEFTININEESNPNDGLVAYYPFNGNAYDESGNGNNGIILGGVTTTYDRHGVPNKAMQFDGINGYISVPTSSSLQSPSTAITIAAWVWLDGFNGLKVAGLVNKTNTSSYGQYHLSYQAWSTPQIVFRYDNGTKGLSVLRSLNLSQWYFIVTTYDGSKVSMYLDGNLIGSEPATGSIIQDGNPLTIGLDSPGETEFLKGKMDDILIYNRALSSDEIQALYHEGGW